MAPAALASSALGDRLGFLAEAREQGSCQVTGKLGVRWHPHHVVYEKHLGRLGAPVYDRRNVLRVDVDAHANHHSGARKIRTVELRDCNIAYAAELMGARAAAYLRRYYDDATDPDPRLETL